MTINECCNVCRAYFPSCTFSVSEERGLNVLSVHLDKSCQISMRFMPDIYYRGYSGEILRADGETLVTEQRLVRTLKRLKKSKEV